MDEFDWEGAERRKNYLLIGVFAVIAAGIIFTIYWFTLPENKRNPRLKEYEDCMSNLRTIAAALETYAKENQGAYPETLAELSPKYMNSIVKCPTAGKDTYSESYEVYLDSDDPRYNRFTLYCSGSFHEEFTHAPNYPQYISDMGMREEAPRKTGPEE
ncbi:MAG: hypothetical protein ACLFQV_04170 [Vulcanimicrobiota bacterium]